MANAPVEVPLPESVERLLNQICELQNQTPPDKHVKRQLALLGQEKATELLTRISRTEIRNISALIMSMIQKVRVQSSPKSIPSSPTSSRSRRLPNSPTGLLAKQRLLREYFQSPPHLRPERKEGPEITPALVALGELEFRKAFLLLSYIGKERLEDVMGADEIRNWKELPMGKFESAIWERLGEKFVKREDRRLPLQWDSGKTHVYHCHVFPDGSLRFKGPYLQNLRTHLQSALGDDHVLIVKFSEEGGSSHKINISNNNDLYWKLRREGILVGLRRYRFFVFKDGGKEEKKKESTVSAVKCYFVLTESNASIDEGQSYILSSKTVAEARHLFMHSHTLPNITNYMARFSLILSKTLKLDVDWASLSIQEIDDIECKDEAGNVVRDNDKVRIHTDGTGFISKDLALLCPKNVFKGKQISNENSKGIFNKNDMEMQRPDCSTWDPPLLIQFRLFDKGRAVKGTLLINDKLPPNTIQVRQSMIKVKTDSNLSDLPTINSLEIVATSNQQKKTYLSRNLIALLSYGGVPNEYFMSIVENALQDAFGVFSRKRSALKVAINYGDMDDYIAARKIFSGIPLDEPYLQHRLSILKKEEMKSLRGGKLHVPECFYLMGTADPTGCLQKDQVCIVLENGQISGDVLVYRNPGLHFGDIHVLHATYVKELESYIGNSKYAIFFPCVGPRSLADEMAGGDFDGDMFWVSRNPQLLHYFRKAKPWVPSPVSNVVSVNTESKRPAEFSEEELEDELFRLFLATVFQPSHAVGEAADSWLALMDRLLTLGDDCIKEKECLKANILKLIDIYYDALDAPKKGGKVQVPEELKVDLYPHYMERENSFKSSSILGLIYDKVSAYQDEDQSLKQEIRKLPEFEMEVAKPYFDEWYTKYSNYRKDMCDALKHGGEGKEDAADEVIKKYKMILYGAPELEESSKSIEQIYDEALIIYHLAYDYANYWGNVRYCSFAWKVAGSALLKLYGTKQNERSLPCLLSPSVLRECFG